MHLHHLYLGGYLNVTFAWSDTALPAVAPMARGGGLWVCEQHACVTPPGEATAGVRACKCCWLRWLWVMPNLAGPPMPACLLGWSGDGSCRAASSVPALRASPQLLAAARSARPCTALPSRRVVPGAVGGARPPDIRRHAGGGLRHLCAGHRGLLLCARLPGTLARSLAPPPPRGGHLQCGSCLQVPLLLLPQACLPTEPLATGLAQQGTVRIMIAPPPLAPPPEPLQEGCLVSPTAATLRCDFWADSPFSLRICAAAGPLPSHSCD